MNMCYYITIGLPANKAELLPEHVPRDLHIEQVANRSALEQMGAGYSAYLLTTGGCSCALFGEPADDAGGGREARARSKQQRRRRKYEKMGWSTAKIDRALCEQATHHKAEALVGLRADVQRFLGELAMQIGEVAVVVHWYDDVVQDARFTCKRGPIVLPEAALGENLRLNPDEIVRIKV
jgi:hypothetical protein